MSTQAIRRDVTHRRQMWTAQEDAVLREAVQRYGCMNWVAVSRLIPGRSSKSCSDRWRTYLNPEVLRVVDTHFTEWEVATIIEAQKVYHNNWKQISLHLPGRTNRAVKNFFTSTLRRGDKLPTDNKYLNEGWGLTDLTALPESERGYPDGLVPNTFPNSTPPAHAAPRPRPRRPNMRDIMAESDSDETDSLEMLRRDQEAVGGTELAPVAPRVDRERRTRKPAEWMLNGDLRKMLGEGGDEDEDEEEEEEEPEPEVQPLMEEEVAEQEEEGDGYSSQHQAEPYHSRYSHHHSSGHNRLAQLLRVAVGAEISGSPAPLDSPAEDDVSSDFPKATRRQIVRLDAGDAGDAHGSGWGATAAAAAAASGFQVRPGYGEVEDSPARGTPDRRVRFGGGCHSVAQAEEDLSMEGGGWEEQCVADTEAFGDVIVGVHPRGKRSAMAPSAAAAAAAAAPAAPAAVTGGKLQKVQPKQLSSKPPPAQHHHHHQQQHQQQRPRPKFYRRKRYTPPRRHELMASWPSRRGSHQQQQEEEEPQHEEAGEQYQGHAYHQEAADEDMEGSQATASEEEGEEEEEEEDASMEAAESSEEVDPTALDLRRFSRKAMKRGRPLSPLSPLPHCPIPKKLMKMFQQGFCMPGAFMGGYPAPGGMMQMGPYGHPAMMGMPWGYPQMMGMPGAPGPFMPPGGMMPGVMPCAPDAAAAAAAAAMAAAAAAGVGGDASSSSGQEEEMEEATEEVPAAAEQPQPQHMGMFPMGMPGAGGFPMAMPGMMPGMPGMAAPMGWWGAPAAGAMPAAAPGSPSKVPGSPSKKHKKVVKAGTPAAPAVIPEAVAAVAAPQLPSAVEVPAAAAAAASNALPAAAAAAAAHQEDTDAAVASAAAAAAAAAKAAMDAWHQQQAALQAAAVLPHPQAAAAPAAAAAAAMEAEPVSAAGTPPPAASAPAQLQLKASEIQQSPLAPGLVVVTGSMPTAPAADVVPAAATAAAAGGAAMVARTSSTSADVSCTVTRSPRFLMSPTAAAAGVEAAAGGSARPRINGPPVVLITDMAATAVVGSKGESPVVPTLVSPKMGALVMMGTGAGACKAPAATASADAQPSSEAAQLKAKKPRVKHSRPKNNALAESVAAVAASAMPANLLAAAKMGAAMAAPQGPACFVGLPQPAGGFPGYMAPPSMGLVTSAAPGGPFMMPPMGRTMQLPHGAMWAPHPGAPAVHHQHMVPVQQQQQHYQQMQQQE